MQSRPKRARVLTRGERRVMGRPSRSMPQGGLRLRLRCATTAALVDAGRLPEPGCLREGARSYAKVKHVLSQRRGCRTTGSGGEDLLALLAQLTLRPDVPVERHRPDTELPAEFGHKGVRGTATHREPGSTRRDHPQHRGREAGCPDAHAARAEPDGTTGRLSPIFGGCGFRVSRTLDIGSPLVDSANARARSWGTPIP